ncbi:Dymeclin [Plasmodiophora brassicae]
MGNASSVADGTTEVDPESHASVWMSRLMSTPIAIDDEASWAKAWAHLLPACNVICLRTIKEKQPYNLAAMVHLSLVKLEDALKAHDRIAAEPDDILHIVRLLTRILPVTLEDADDEFNRGFMAQGVLPRVAFRVVQDNKDADHPRKVQPAVSGSLSEHPYALDDHDGAPKGDVADSVIPSSGNADAVDVKEQASSREQTSPVHPSTSSAEGVCEPSSPSCVTLSVDRVDAPSPRLMRVLIDLLFVPGFTLQAQPAAPSTHFELPNVSAELVWGFGDMAQIDAHRVELLRLLIACSAVGLFRASEQFAHEFNPLLKIAVDDTLAETLLCSLLHTITEPLPSASGTFSFMSWGTALDAREELVLASLHALLIILDYRRLEADDDPVNPLLGSLSQMRLPSNLSRVYSALTSLLGNAVSAATAYLSRSVQEFDCYQEVFILLWKLIDICPAFREFVVTRADSSALLQPLLYIMSRSKHDMTQIGIVHTCAMLMLKLSSNREFALAFNASCGSCPVVLGAPGNLSMFNGSYADLLVIVSCEIMFGSMRIESLNHMLLTTITNVTPYVRDLSWASSSALVDLFEHFSKPDVLWSSRSVPQYLLLLIEAFNNVLQYQYSGNPRLVYAMTRKSSSFLNLCIDGDESREGANRADAGPPTVEQLSPESEPRPDAQAEAPATEASAAVENDDVTSQPSSPVRRETAASISDDHPAVTNDGTIPRRRSSNVLAEMSPASRKAWVQSWLGKFPLLPIRRTLEFLLPRMNSLYESGAYQNEAQVMAFFKDLTLVGVLPLPHPITVRQYSPSRYTSVWFSSLLWGVIFLRHQRTHLFDPSSIRLFVISNARDS